MTKEIIVYAGGAAGDLVAAAIDPTDYVFHGTHFTAKVIERVMLRNRYTSGMTYLELDSYINNSKYKSLASHNPKYHIEQKHDFIFVDSGDTDYAKWAANRFTDLWYTKLDWMKSPMDYNYHIEMAIQTRPYTNKIITLQEILEGKMLSKLRAFTKYELYTDQYQVWLTHNKFN